MPFGCVKAQEAPIQILKKHIEGNRLEGGYLFSGPEGVGKKLSALVLAKAVNCLELEGEACDSCASCKKINSFQHPDVRLINSDSEIKIENVRVLQKEISLRAYEARKKVFIIDDAHKLTVEASNALLKVLEEPPGRSLIILVTDKPGRLLKTVVSRCKVVRFSPVRREVLFEVLKKEHAIDTDRARFLAYFSEGRLGFALRLKEKDILKEKNRLIDGVVFGGANLSLQKKEELSFGLNILSAWFRDIYMVKIGLAEAEIINFDRQDELARAAGKISFLELNKIVDFISASMKYLEQNINSKLLMQNLRLSCSV